MHEQVRENLMFSANLRLPVSISKNEKQCRVEDTIELLGLWKCANSKIGTEMIRGVSGGERKRCSIGMELVVDPAVIFLDEPTRFVLGRGGQIGYTSHVSHSLSICIQRVGRVHGAQGGGDPG